MLILLSFSLCSSLQERLKHFCFLIFMVVLFTSGIIVHLFLPETKGKSIMEITEEFNKLNFKNKRIPETSNHVTEDYSFCTRLWPAVRGNQIFEKSRRKTKRHLPFSDYQVAPNGLSAFLSVTYKVSILPNQLLSQALHSGQLWTGIRTDINRIDLCESWAILA